MVETLIVLIWLGFCIKTSLKGRKRQIGFQNTLTICILFTPIVGEWVIKTSEKL